MEQVAKDSDRDYFLGAVAGKDYGLVDFVIEKHAQTEAPKK